MSALSSPTLDGLPATNSLPPSSVANNPAVNTLIESILAADCLDEISDIDNGDSIRRYITSQGKAKDGVLRKGVIFWLYPTGFIGLVETLEQDCERGKKGDVLHHGVLVTAEAGVNVEAAVKVMSAAIPVNGIATLHVHRT